jgi:Rho-binding antiterminator
MNTIETPYRSLACSSYDQLESLAMRKSKCTITYLDGSELKKETGIITDLFSRGGAEYITLNTTLVIRLDQLIDVNGISMQSQSC